MLLPCVDGMDEINRPGMRGGREDERGGLPVAIEILQHLNNVMYTYCKR